VCVCQYGAAYVPLADDVLIAGAVVADTEVHTTAQKKLLKRDREAVVRLQDLQRVMRTAIAVSGKYEDDLERDKQQIREAYTATGKFRQDALASVGDQVRDTAAGIHDVWNLVLQIIANCKTIFEKRFPGLDPDEAADRLHNEGAIYFCALQMLGKIEVALFLEDSSLMHADIRTFRLHGLVSKHVKIYMNRAVERHLDVFTGSGSFGMVRGPVKAISIVIQALVDNAIKYAPTGSKVTFAFEDTKDRVYVRVISLGPLIEDAEKSEIFAPFTRAKAAREMSETGMGVGLSAAAKVSDELHMGLTVEQSTTPDKTFHEFYDTQFEFSLPKIGFDQDAADKQRA